MKMILFDLGETLKVVRGGRDELLPGASETLKAVAKMKDAQGKPPVLALVSDFGPGAATPAQAAAARAEYLEILDALGIRRFFEPVEERVTISAEVGATKPSRKIFQRVLDKVPGLRFKDVLFVTEELTHVEAARKLQMSAVHFKGPGETTGDVSQLTDLLPLVRSFLKSGL